MTTPPPESDHQAEIDADAEADADADADPDLRDDISTVSCALCGTTVVGPPLTWMFEVDARRGGRWYCDRCARENLRSVEAKLDQEWW